MAKNLGKDLLAFNKEIKALAKKMEKIAVAVGKLEKANAPKTTRRSPARKKTTKPKPAVKRAASKKAQKMTAADTVLGIIQRYKKGRDTKALMVQTGFDQKKIANIIFKLKQQGKIKSPSRGIYVKA